MDLSSDRNPVIPAQDVATVVEDEFQQEVLVGSGKSSDAKDSKISPDLWDSLWKPVAPGVVNPAVNPVVNQAFNQVFSQVANPVFCLACDTMFNNRPALEQHMCPFASFICSCGVSFSKYPEMWSHSTSHSHKATYVVNHTSAIQSRVSSVKEQESTLKILQATTKNVAVVQKGTASPTTLPPSVARYLTGQTVNLWRRFRPVVKLETLQRFHQQNKYTCAICRESRCTRDKLVEHVAAAHSSTCIYGCSRCGLILIGSVPPKPQHRCGSFHTGPSRRFTVGQVLRDPLAAERLYMPYACQHCTLKFCHPVHLNNHMRFNHTDVSKVRGAPAIKARSGGPRGAASAPSRAGRTGKLRCALCGKRSHSVEALGGHWCTRKLPSVEPETEAEPGPEEAPQRSGRAESDGGGGSEVTLRFQDISNMKTLGHTKLLAMKTEPVEVNLKMSQDFSLVKSEPESKLRDDSAEKASADTNGLFYQQCSAPSANSLNYLLSHI